MEIMAQTAGWLSAPFDIGGTTHRTYPDMKPTLYFFLVRHGSRGALYLSFRPVFPKARLPAPRRTVPPEPRSAPAWRRGGSIWSDCPHRIPG